jgi:1,4-alpha-glucan branching enzyme
MADVTTRSHRFKVGETVNMKADIHHRGTPSGVFKVTRQMPAEGQEYQYRIKDNRDGQELVVRESDLY